MDRFWGSYGPNRRLTAYLRYTGPVSTVLFGAIGAYLAWSVLRWVFVSTLPPETGWGETRVGFLLNGAIFAVLISFTAIAASRLHGIDARRFLGDRRVFWADFAAVMKAVGGFYALLFAIYIFVFDAFAGAEMQPLAGWLAFLPLAVAAIAIQTLGEEVFFRGYLHHFASRMFRQPLAWVFLPSAIFGAAHVFNDTASLATILSYIVYITFFGAASVDLTARTGSLGAAWGLHLTNNLFVILISAEVGGFMSGGALYLFAPYEGAPPGTGEIALSLVYNLTFLAVMWLLARNALRL